jgi:hypothetical protein
MHLHSFDKPQRPVEPKVKSSAMSFCFQRSAYQITVEKLDEVLQPSLYGIDVKCSSLVCHDRSISLEELTKHQAKFAPYLAHYQ